MRERLLFSSFSGVFQVACSLVITLISIPLFIKYLDIEQYGTYATIAVIGNLNVFANLGLNTSLIKYISENGKSKSSDQVIIVTIVLLLAFITPITIAVYFSGDFILKELLSVPLESFFEGKLLLNLLLVSNFFLIGGQAFVAVLDALQKVYWSNTVQLVYNVLYWGGSVLLLYAGYGLTGIGVASLVAAISWFIIISIVALKNWPLNLFAIQPKYFIGIAKSQLSYGLKLYATGVIAFCYEPLSKVFIAKFIGLPEVGFFDIALKVKSQIWGVILKVMYPLMPFIANINDNSKIGVLIKEVEQKIILILIPLIIGIIYCTHPFVQVWLTDNNNKWIICESIMYVTIAHLLSVISLPIYNFFMVKGYPGLTTLIQLSNVLLNGLLFLIAFKYLGFYAAIMGNCVAQLVSFGIAMYYQKKLLSINLLDKRQFGFKVVSSFFIITFLLFCIQKYEFGNMESIILFPILIVIITLVVYRYLKVVSDGDLEKFLGDSKLAQIAKFVLVG